MKKIVLIPAYQPKKILGDIVAGLVQAGFLVIVVDDGSGKEYLPFFDRLKKSAVVLSYAPNRGKGFALKTGLQYIAQNEPDAVVVTMDADGQHLVSDAERLCREAEESRADLVIGSRVMPKDAPTRSRLGNGITRLVFRAVTGVKIYDTQSGLRAFRSGLIPELLEIPGERYEYEMNVLLSMARKKRSIKEIQIRTIYFDKQNSVSHFDTVKDSAKIYLEIIKFAGSSLLSFLVDYGLYSLILMLAGTGEILLANVGARAVSACVNFTVNKKMVFRSNGKLAEEAIKYFSLALAILCVNTVLLEALTSLGFNAYLAKIAVELLMFLFSYAMQHTLIFRKGRKA